MRSALWFRSSTSLRNPWRSRASPRKRRKSDGTACSYGTTCGGVLLSAKWTRGSPWAAIASATDRVRLGPMVTPLARRRPAKVAKETATLDRLSHGRLILGVALGSDSLGAELSKTGEELDDRVRGEMLDEMLGILIAAWYGEPVKHQETHYVVDDVQFLPRPVQPKIPVWPAAFPDNMKPTCLSSATSLTVGR